MNDLDSPSPYRSLLLLDDGRTGHWRQVTALAQHLPFSATSLRFSLRQPWRAFAPRRLVGGRWAHRDQWEGLSDKAPVAIIGCGRRSALFARWLADRWQREPRLIQILDSGLDPSVFNRVIAPRHDRLDGGNIIQTLGSLNPVDEDWLALGALEGPEMADYPAPRVAVLLGGPVRGFRFDQSWLRGALNELADEVESRSGSLLIVLSPRSPGWAAGVASALPESIIHHVVEWPASAARYAAVLAHATHIAVTGDSVNMISEACATGKPVRVIGSDQMHGKRRRFLNKLAEQGHVAKEQWLKMDSAPPLREAANVAQVLVDSGLFD